MARNEHTFQPGQSGNPRGRPRKGAHITDFLRWGAAQAVSDEDRRTRAEAVALKALEQAMAGDPAFARLVLDRLDGPVAQKQEISGPDGGPVVLSWPQAEQS